MICSIWILDLDLNKERMGILEEVIGHIHSLESFGSADGPGVRFVIFMSG